MTDTETSGPGRDVEAASPDQPTELPPRAWRTALRRTVGEVFEDELPDKAATLTYYGVLSLFPTLLMLISLVGAAGESAVRRALDTVRELAPGPAREILTTAVEELQRSSGTSKFIAVISMMAALWAASAYVGAFIRASNVVYDIPEGRPLWKVTPLRVGLTVVLVLLLACSTLIVVFTGPLARRAGEAAGIGDGVMAVWAIAKWPVLGLLVVLMLALLYWAAPNAKVRGFRWLSPGSGLAVLLWLAASAGFALYLANFNTYNQTYGSMAGVVIFLLWVWLTNLAILIGLEFDSELARQRAVAGGLPEEEEPYVRPRDTRSWPRRLRERRKAGSRGQEK
ncbi:YihY/virulence factor BrkB family protein [Streptomyces sp. 184]|uniref:YihY/virulence factor BrkB family protein n=1 Tax=Streptomyces sp. 184 TaxID=1827526 RepID=UPI0038915E70